jgi:hypothetical protein
MICLNMELLCQLTIHLNDLSNLVDQMLDLPR